MRNNITNIEVHVKQYGITKSKNPKKDKQIIGLQTRLIIATPNRAKEILDFDFQYQAIKYVRDKFGDIYNIGKTYNILNNYKLYGNAGYKWK